MINLRLFLQVASGDVQAWLLESLQHEYGHPQGQAVTGAWGTLQRQVHFPISFFRCITGSTHSPLHQGFDPCTLALVSETTVNDDTSENKFSFKQRIGATINFI